ncbi:MAG: hypothetical protein WCQ90_07000 [Deltaproteobacteria bacterium]
MIIHPKVHLDHLQRMADFHRWGYAISEALHAGGGEIFIREHMEHNASKSTQLIHNNAFLEAVLKFMTNRRSWGSWGGYIREVWELMAEIAGHGKKHASFPKTPRMLRQELMRIKNALGKRNIAYQISEKHDEKGFRISFRKNEILLDQQAFAGCSKPEPNQIGSCFLQPWREIVNTLHILGGENLHIPHSSLLLQMKITQTEVGVETK